MSSESALKQGNCFSELCTSVADVSFRSANATGLSSLQLWLASSIRGFPSFSLGGSNPRFRGDYRRGDRASNRPGVGRSFFSSDCCRLRPWLFGRIAFPLRRDRMLFLRVCKYIRVVGGLVRNPTSEDTESRTVRGGGWKRTGLSDHCRTARSYRLRKVADEIRASFCRWFAAA